MVSTPRENTHAVIRKNCDSRRARKENLSRCVELCAYFVPEGHLDFALIQRNPSGGPRHPVDQVYVKTAACSADWYGCAPCRSMSFLPPTRACRRMQAIETPAPTPPCTPRRHQTPLFHEPMLPCHALQWLAAVWRVAERDCWCPLPRRVPARLHPCHPAAVVSVCWLRSGGQPP